MTEKVQKQKFEGLSQDEIREINSEISRYEDKSAVSIEALKIVQKHRRWVSDETLLAVAEFLELPAGQLEGVATFYNLIYRQPVGKTVIHYCDSVACWMLGAEKIRESLCLRLNVDLGEMSANGEYTILPAACLGACDHAPVMMVGGELRLDVTEETVNDIFNEKR